MTGQAGQAHTESPAYVVLALVAALVAAVFGGMSTVRAVPAEGAPPPSKLVQPAISAGADLVSAASAPAERPAELAPH